MIDTFKISKEDFRDLVISKVIASEYTRESKNLFIVVTLKTNEIKFLVTINKVVKLETPDLEEAILEYNRYK